MKGLEELLDRATDAIESHVDHAGVLTLARRRRTRRRGLVVGATAAAAVAAVVVSVQVVGGETQSHEVPPATHAPSPPARDASWDPREVASLPPAADDVAALLPDTLDVPDVAPHVEDDPVDAAVLSVDDGADVLLLGADGRWRCVVVEGKSQPSPVLSPLGTRLAVATVHGVVTVDLVTGRQTHLPVPEGFEPVGEVPALWMWWADETRLVVTDGGGEWVLDVDRGTDHRVPDLETAATTLGVGRPSILPAAADWDVRPVAELADGTALLRVAPPAGRDRSTWWVVRWDPESGDLALASTVDAAPGKATSFARDLVARP